MVTTTAQLSKNVTAFLNKPKQMLYAALGALEESSKGSAGMKLCLLSIELRDERLLTSYRAAPLTNSSISLSLR
jgi:hypothetical protein